MKINFILPFFPSKAGGGSKIMYEYASRLALLGHDVSVYHALNTPWMEYRVPAWLRKLKNKLIFPDARPNWFQLSTKVKTFYVDHITDEYIANADATIGTWWAVAYQIAQLSASKGKKINLIQDYEIWTGHEDLVRASYKLPIHHVVISDYLSDLVKSESGIEPSLIYNAIDNTIFSIKDPIAKREVQSVMMMYSEEKRKGMSFGMEALRLSKAKFPDLKVTLFGVYNKPENLESWIEYHQSPKNLSELYNRNAIYMTSSNAEGWALPPCEALFCGCALVATNIGGHKVYAIDNETALLTEPGNVESMVNQLSKLLGNSDLRIDLAKRGNEYVKQFTWDEAIRKMLNVMQA